LRISIHTAKRLVELARHLDKRPMLDAALGSGVVNVEQAAVIATAVADLPGATCLDNGVLLCGHHHWVVHHDGWQVQLGHARRPEFIPPPYVDPGRRPRRNTYHRRP
jgi:hypothetical protein